jgi:putative DNA primase/helicase
MSTSNYGAAGGSGRLLNSLGLVHQLAEIISSTDAFAVDAGGMLYIYRNGVYIPEAEKYVKQAVKGLLIAYGESRRWSRHLSDEIVAYLALSASALWNRAPLDQMNVANGVLDLQRRTLEPHTPAYLSTVQLPVRFDPAAPDCVAWTRFLKTVLAPDIFEGGVIWQLLALLMIPYTDAHQAILLSGPGGNGKGALLAAIRAFLGEHNVSSLNLDQITGERFSAANLHGRLANVCDDLATRHLSDTSTFKRIVGGDPITADRKHRDPITFRPFARLLFSTNEFPQSADASSGFYDRWVVIPFDADFRGQQSEVPRHILDRQLSTEQELSGVLNRSLAALPSILGRRLPATPSMKAAHDEFRNSTDWVLIWLERMIVAQPTAAIEKRAIYNALVNEAQRQRRAVISPAALYQKIRTHWPNVDESQRRLDPARNSLACFVGLTWRSGVPPL